MALPTNITFLHGLTASTGTGRTGGQLATSEFSGVGGCEFSPRVSPVSAIQRWEKRSDIPFIYTIYTIYIPFVRTHLSKCVQVWGRSKPQAPRVPLVLDMLLQQNLISTAAAHHWWIHIPIRPIWYVHANPCDYWFYWDIWVLLGYIAIQIWEKVGFIGMSIHNYP